MSLWRSRLIGSNFSAGFGFTIPILRANDIRRATTVIESVKSASSVATDFSDTRFVDNFGLRGFTFAVEGGSYDRQMVVPNCSDWIRRDHGGDDNRRWSGHNTKSCGR